MSTRWEVCFRQRGSRRVAFSRIAGSGREWQRIPAKDAETMLRSGAAKEVAR